MHILENCGMANLLPALEHGQKDLLQKMQDLDGEMQSLTACASFIHGFCLAAQLLTNALAGQRDD